MDLTVFPLYADGSTGDAVVETKLSQFPPHAAHELGAHILEGVEIVEEHLGGEKPVALDITLTLDTAMTRVDAKTAEEARQHAIDWQHWMNTQSLSYGELAEWQSHFEKLAERFDLTDEFKENGIL